MVFKLLRAAIFVFGFCLCMAEDSKLDNSTCKFSEEDIEEFGSFSEDCLKNVKPDGDVDKMYEDTEYLSDQLNTDNGFSVETAKTYINKMTAETSQSVKDDLLVGIDKCAKGKNPDKDGLKFIECVDGVYEKVCYDEE